jgi:hypothetical protein
VPARTRVCHFPLQTWSIGEQAGATDTFMFAECSGDAQHGLPCQSGGGEGGVSDSGHEGAAAAAEAGLFNDPHCRWTMANAAPAEDENPGGWGPAPAGVQAAGLGASSLLATAAALPALAKLFLNGNRLQGTVPASFGLLEAGVGAGGGGGGARPEAGVAPLSHVALHGNRLGGPPPAEAVLRLRGSLKLFNAQGNPFWFAQTPQRLGAEAEARILTAGETQRLLQQELGTAAHVYL